MMNVQLKSELTKTKPYPDKDIRNQTGWVKHVLSDGFCLIQFDKIFRATPLQWYVHEEDFYIKQCN